jgi:hypothetical protein
MTLASESGTVRSSPALTTPLPRDGATSVVSCMALGLGLGLGLRTKPKPVATDLGLVARELELVHRGERRRARAHQLSGIIIANAVARRLEPARLALPAAAEVLLQASPLEVAPYTPPSLHLPLYPCISCMSRHWTRRSVGETRSGGSSSSRRTRDAREAARAVRVERVDMCAASTLPTRSALSAEKARSIPRLRRRRDSAWEGGALPADDTRRPTTRARGRKCADLC